MMYKDNFFLLKLLYIVGIYLDEYWFMGPSDRFHSYIFILDCLGYVCIWVKLPVQRRLCPIFVRDVGSPDIHECFRGLTSSQQTPGFWGVTLHVGNTSIFPLPSLDYWDACKSILYLSISKHNGSTDNKNIGSREKGRFTPKI